MPARFSKAALTALTLSVALIGPVPPPLYAAEGGREEGEVEPIVVAERIVVVGRRSYRGNATTVGTKTETPPVDIPQALTVISADLIADQAFRSMADVVRYTPGVLIGQGEGHRDQITLRGNNTTADFFLDGVRDDVQYYRSLYNLERIEILKGPNALIFGRGGGGGVVNRVLKRPLDENLAGAFAAIDTFGGFEFAADVNRTIGDAAGFRVNAFYEKGRNHRDVYELERYATNPTVRAELGAATRLDLSYEFAHDERVVDRGVPSLDGRPLEGFDNTFFGAPGVNTARFDGHFASLGLSHEFSEALTGDIRLAYGNFDKVYRNAFPATAVTAGAVGVEAYEDPTKRRNFFAQGNLIWKTDTGPVGHTILVGAEAGDQRTRNERINGFFDSGVPTTSSGRRTLVPFADPFLIPPPTFRAGPGNRAVLSEADVYSAYVQDQAKIGEHVEIVAGARLDRFDLALSDLLGSPSFERRDDVVSPRAALILKPSRNASLYGSYSRSFLPQSGDQFLSLDASLATLEPEKFDNLEFGAKWDLTPSLSATAAVYRLDRENTRAPGATPGSIVLTGAQRSRGLEVGLVGSITDRLSVLAGYAWQDAEITQTTSAAPSGRNVAQVPRHHVTAWGRYDFSERFGVGLGIQRQTQSFASITNAVILPSFTRVDAAIYVGVGERLEAQVNIQNLLNADYFPTAHNDNNITTGAPVSAIFSMRARI